MKDAAQACNKELLKGTKSMARLVMGRETTVEIPVLGEGTEGNDEMAPLDIQKFLQLVIGHRQGSGTFPDLRQVQRSHRSLLSADVNFLFKHSLMTTGGNYHVIFGNMT
jgi:hypothetical protein